MEIFSLLLGIWLSPAPAAEAANKKISHESCEDILRANPAANNFFERLGLPASGDGVDTEAVKQAARGAAKQFHADRGGTDEQMRAIFEARDSLKTEDQICNYRNSVACQMPTRLQALYSGELMQSASGLRERQKVLNELQADLDASAAQFAKHKKGIENVYYFGEFLRTQHPEASRMTLDRFSKAIRAERERMYRSGLVWAVFAEREAVVARSLLAIVFSKDTPHELRTRLTVMLIAEGYLTEMSQQLMGWLIDRTQNQAELASLLLPAISNRMEGGVVIAKYIHERYFKERAFSETNARQDEARSAAGFLSSLLGQFQNSDAFIRVLSAALDLWARSTVREFRGDPYLSLGRQDSSDALELRQLAGTRFGSLGKFLAQIEPTTSSRIFALFNWEAILNAAIGSQFKNPEFELIIYGLFSESKTGSSLSYLFERERTRVLETLAISVKSHALFEHDSVLALAEKYPLFEKWGESQLTMGK